MKKIFQAILLSSVMVFAACSEEESNFDNGAAVRTFNLDGAKFNMIKVEGGTFLMGAQSTDPSAANYDPSARENEGPVHSVTLSTFYIAEFETTCNIVRKAGISAGMGRESNMPIRNIYRKDVLQFVEKLNEIMHANGQLAKNEKFALPTEAQWEYAARGGKYSHNYIYSGSNDYNKVAYCQENSDMYSFTKVGSFDPNELGLYDMSGNCFEMCIDDWGMYSEESQVDPQGPATVTDSKSYVMKGGSFYVSKTLCRVTYRGQVNDDTEANSFTVRLALVNVK
jgi:formylglycine-generating enzyme required for sulfatase activity